MSSASMSPQRALTLRIADSFWLRLRGLYGVKALAENEGLLILPCRAIHTLFLKQSIDVIFLDAHGNVCRCLPCLAPNRLVWERKATMVVELPAGYCRRYPDFAKRVHAALQLRVFPRLPE